LYSCNMLESKNETGEGGEHVSGKCVFITGGVRSGKSAFAEEYITRYKQNCQAVYIASGVAFDEEMKKRIQRHQYDRRQNSWLTMEVPDRFPEAFSSLHRGHILLWDCITTWLTNVLVADLPVKEMFERLKSQLIDWRKKDITIVIVSNEVFDSGISDFEFTRNYQQLLGELNQWLVAFCDEAYELDYGIMKRWKG
jgi:adenosylcobinamide kinase / adenosylcobinamide-phosphate guanylyltransferase